MTESSKTAPTSALRRFGPPLPLGAAAGVAAAVLAIIAITWLSYLSYEQRAQDAEAAARTQEVVNQLTSVLSIVKDAETSQRGFLLTGSEPYLGPYDRATAALPSALRALRSTTEESVRQKRRRELLEQLVATKMDELAHTIALRRGGDAVGALSVVQSDRGKAVMDDVRRAIGEMQDEERDQLARRQAAFRESEQRSLAVIWGGSVVLLLLVSSAAVLLSRDSLARERLQWIRLGQMGIAERIQGEQRLEVLGQAVLDFLAAYLGARVGAIHIAESGGRLRRFAAHALAADGRPEVVDEGAGLLGQAARENRVIRVPDVPPGYLDVSSGTGAAAPRELLIVPAAIDGHVQSVIELGFLRPARDEERELLERVSEMLAIAVRASKDRTRLEELLAETQRQGEELQAQQEELRVSNEELEEQSRVLTDSHARLEEQQAEMEATNAQLEQQASALETQRDALATAQAGLVEKATELLRANQVKSEFLANMSHELRTPLNSALILAKLLADNKDGNLKDEQVRFAQTIYSAGNDLLALINDILDLSKIEAGKIEVMVDDVDVPSLLSSLRSTFEPVAREKSLAFSAALMPGAPMSLRTDAQRLAQILRNLLSNALKFTEKGEVSLQVSAARDGLDFTVRDSGIGIPEHQQDLIFEAFRQADGSTHRKYGGTGLGLSISRDLARLLGGDIALSSTPGAGSTFTLHLPMSWIGSVASPAPAADLMPAPVLPRPPRAPAISDDRDQLAEGRRRVLVIEDDARFAAILRDLAHEMGFQCVVADTAGAGLAAAATFRPSAILLDMNLPDHSGLGVLDQLKRDPHTRHVPVHVMSVADYSQAALQLGAVGYALKPVRREEIVAAFKRLEDRISRELRRVLVVEDDERQRDSIRELLSMQGVEITTVATAQEAIAQLGALTFDCMVMDLNLPDLSGYELLQRMADTQELSFPPVIVYTGRSLTPEQEQQLRRHSKSIIIKDVRSPERLLDEVTLFLHQVESELPADSQRILKAAREREAALDGRCVLVAEDDVRNVFALCSVLEPRGVKVEIARNGREAIEKLQQGLAGQGPQVDLVLMDVMMPEMDGLAAMREVRRERALARLPIIALTAKATRSDQEQCLAAGANDYIAKPLDVEKLLSLVRVWMPK